MYSLNKYIDILTGKFRSKSEKMGQSCLLFQQFDKKYKTIVRVRASQSYTEMLDWIDSNSNGSVDIRFNDTPEGDGTIVIDIAFENRDDALFFKIKYPYET